MSGFEGPAVAAVAKAGAKAVATAAEEDPDVKKKLIEMAESSPAMGNAAEAFARRQEVWQRVRLRVLQPLARFTGLGSDYFVLDFEKDLESRLAGVPEENLRTPPLNVAVPAMMGLSYSLDEEAIREMYLNLIARASDDRAPDAAHPAFAEIIKQLSAPEAVDLLGVLRLKTLPIVQLRRETVDPEKPTRLLGPGHRPGTTFYNHLTSYVDEETGEPAEHPKGPMFIDNWIRLGLIEVDYVNSFQNPTWYEWVPERPEYQRLAAELESLPTADVGVRNGMLTATAFGEAFFEAVGPIPSPSDEAEQAPTS